MTRRDSRQRAGLGGGTGQLLSKADQLLAKCMRRNEVGALVLEPISRSNRPITFHAFAGAPVLPDRKQIVANRLLQDPAAANSRWLLRCSAPRQAAPERAYRTWLG